MLIQITASLIYFYFSAYGFDTFHTSLTLELPRKVDT